MATVAGPALPVTTAVLIEPGRTFTAIAGTTILSETKTSCGRSFDAPGAARDVTMTLRANTIAVM